VQENCGSEENCSRLNLAESCAAASLTGRQGAGSRGGGEGGCVRERKEELKLYR